MAEHNPYVALRQLILQMIDSARDPGWGTGVVTSSIPFEFKYMGIVIKEDQIYRGKTYRGTPEGYIVVATKNRADNQYYVHMVHKPDDEEGDA